MELSKRNKILRYPARGSYDHNQLLEILDRNFVCQIAFEEEGQPFVIPMNFSNDREHLYLHGSQKSRIMNFMASGKDLAISILEVNGIILRKKIVDNSLNYVSAVLYGKGKEIQDFSLKLNTFKLLMDKMVPGRWGNTMMPDDKDMADVMVVQVDVEDFSIKINQNNNGESAGNEQIWYGVLPISRIYSHPTTTSKVPIPDYIYKLLTAKSP